MTFSVVGRQSRPLSIQDRPRLATFVRRPNTLTLVTQGPQGPMSPGFGLVRYAEASSQGMITLDAGVRTLVTMVIDPTQTSNDLKGPFASQPLWDGTTLTTPAVNDAHQVRLALNASAIVSGGSLRLEAQLVTGGAILEAKDAALPSAAGNIERVAFDLTLFAGATYVAAGVQLYLTSSVPVSVQNETLLIVPLTSGQ